MVEVSCEVLIPTDAGRVFDVITDFAGQERWLAKTATFRGTSAVSSNPVTLGTTYRERGPLGVRTGVVTEFVRATQVTFDQPMALSLGLGRVELVVRYTLTSQGESTRVRRAVRVGVPRRLKPIEWLLIRPVRSESRRTLLALKGFTDSRA